VAKGADCKSAGVAIVGSSPTSPTTLKIKKKWRQAALEESCQGCILVARNFRVISRAVIWSVFLRATIMRPMKDDSDDARTKFLKALDRAARIQILGIRDLYKPGHHPRHRPPTIDAALKRDEIAQFVGIYRALHRYRNKRESISAAVKLFGCKRAYVYKVGNSSIRRDGNI
jgi:hypothetical protein